MNVVPVEEKKLDSYANIASEKLLSEVSVAAKRLQGLRVVHAIPFSYFPNLAVNV